MREEDPKPGFEHSSDHEKKVAAIEAKKYRRKKSVLDDVLAEVQGPSDEDLGLPAKKRKKS